MATIGAPACLYSCYQCFTLISKASQQKVSIFMALLAAVPEHKLGCVRTIAGAGSAGRSRQRGPSGLVPKALQPHPCQPA